VSRRLLCAALAIVGGVLASGSPAAAATPNTKITGGPSGPVASTTAAFRFKATVAGATFTCKLDGKPWSDCVSPKTYTKLGQGSHVFRVRAAKKGAVDPSPATRAFTVDTVKPQTTILTGPDGYTEEHSPAFTFESSEPGTFECKLQGAGFEPCINPYTPSAPLGDGFYSFRVRARDQAGNVDGTPAVRGFNPETPLTEDSETAEAAAAFYLPDSFDLDVPPNCNGTPTVDCPAGVPAPPAPQVHFDTSRVVVPVVEQHRYDLTATLDVSSLQTFLITYSGVNCYVTVDSAGDDTPPTWTLNLQLNFFVDAVFGDTYIRANNISMTGLDSGDYSLSGDVLCNLAGALIPASVIQDQLESSFELPDLCAAPGPNYLGPCPELP
jgi:hypothetical protein